MDGHVQLPITIYLLDRFGVEFLDTITEAGIVRYFSGETDSSQTEAALNSIRISLDKHGSRQIAIAAHDDCAANPIQAPQQQTQILEGTAFLKNRFPQCDILGLWVDDARKVHEIAPSYAVSGCVNAWVAQDGYRAIRPFKRDRDNYARMNAYGNIRTTNGRTIERYS